MIKQNKYWGIVQLRRFNEWILDNKPEIYQEYLGARGYENEPIRKK